MCMYIYIYIHMCVISARNFQKTSSLENVVFYFGFHFGHSFGKHVQHMYKLFRSFRNFGDSWAAVPKS